MIIIKFVLMCGIICISSYLGIIKSKTFEIRVDELKKIQTSLNMFKSKIEFTYEPIRDIFEEISMVVYKDEENIFKNTLKELKEKGVRDAWASGIMITKNCLDLEDRETLKLMGKLLGRTDKFGQISEIELTMTLLKKQIEKAEIEKNKNVKLCKTLGTVMGIGIVIILI